MGLPVEDINKLSPNELLSMVAPPIRVPLELATDKHTFFDRPLSEVDNAPKSLKNAPEPVKVIAENLVDYNEETNKVNPEKWHVLSSLLGRGIYTVDKLGDPEVSNNIKLLYAFLGIKGKEVDIEAQRKYKETEDFERLGEFLTGKGVTKEYDPYGTRKYYIPKN